MDSIFRQQFLNDGASPLAADALVSRRCLADFSDREIEETISYLKRKQEEIGHPNVDGVNLVERMKPGESHRDVLNRVRKMLADFGLSVNPEGPPLSSIAVLDEDEG